MSQVFTTKCQLCECEGVHRRCASCKAVYYCSREHQKQDWKSHKNICLATRSTNSTMANGDTSNSVKEVTSSPLQCNKNSNGPGVASDDTSIEVEGSSEAEILSTSVENICPHPKLLQLERDALKKYGDSKYLIQDEPKTSLYIEKLPSLLDMNWDLVLEMCKNVISDLENYGVCVLDNFMGDKVGKAVLEEVINLHMKGVFTDGQLVASDMFKQDEIKNIRGDQIVWVTGRESYCTNIQTLISSVDFIVYMVLKMKSEKLKNLDLSGRTKSMVACYPGSGSHYVKHVDNPNGDGRRITAIYYLNLNWNVNVNGGLLRIFPEGYTNDKVADIEPLFDRLLFFWSDRRNPHEVQPAYSTRFAITLWYFDRAEREEARMRFKKKRENCSKAPPDISKGAISKHRVK